MTNLKEWQNKIEHLVSQHELSSPALFTVMRDKTNELQNEIDALKIEKSKLSHRIYEHNCRIIGAPRE